MKKDLRTPLGKSLGLGSAHMGTKHYSRQILTSCFNVPLFVFFIFIVISLSHSDFVHSYKIMSNPLIAFLFVAMLISGIYHMNLGMQVIIEDYTSSHCIRRFLFLLNNIFCAAVGILSVLAVIKLAMGAFLW